MNVVFWCLVVISVAVLWTADRENKRRDALCLKQTGDYNHTLIDRKPYCLTKDGHLQRLKESPYEED